MKIISRYVKEQRRYTKSEIASIFLLDEEGVVKFIKTLRNYRVLKAVRNTPEQRDMSDLLDEDIQEVDELSEGDRYFYVFTYVGIITIGHRVLKVYPKYIFSNNEPVQEMQQILKVLEKYSHSDEQTISLYSGDEDSNRFNLLSIILYLLSDYYEYGLYSNTDEIIESNGEGEILWGKTIDESMALIRDNRPYYMELYTRKAIDDELDYFKRLHEAIITDCSRQLDAAELTELFDIESVRLTEEKIHSFGETEYILNRISSELSVQFNTRKQILLRTIYAYISQDVKLFEQDSAVSMYGTTSFNLVWEKVCADVLNNKLHSKIGTISLPVPLADEYDSSDRLIDLIEKPLWSGKGFVKEAKETLVPDIITVSRENGRDYFVILDAKYYTVQLEEKKTLRGTPGVSDVTKQYMYQLAYRKFFEDHRFNGVKNCFLMPTEDVEIVDKGTASMRMLGNLGLEDIEIRQMPARRLFAYYLALKKIPVEELSLGEDE